MTVGPMRSCMRMKTWVLFDGEWSYQPTRRRSPAACPISAFQNHNRQGLLRRMCHG